MNTSLHAVRNPIIHDLSDHYRLIRHTPATSPSIATRCLWLSGSRHTILKLMLKQCSVGIVS